MSQLNLNAAGRIGTSLVRDALWYDGRCNWISRVVRTSDPGHSVHGTLSPGLYDGVAGIAWFLVHLYNATESREFLETSRGATRQSLAAASAQPIRLAFSFYQGALGVIVVALEVAHLIGDDTLRANAVRALRKLTALRFRHFEMDLLSGTAGTIAALLIIAVRLKDESLISLAARLGRLVIRRADRSRYGYSWRSSSEQTHPNLTGLSHGSTGIAYALLELFDVTSEVSFLTAAEQAFSYERFWFNAQEQNWPDLTQVSVQSARRSPLSYVTAWCHGAPGIALARLRAFKITGDERCVTEARIALGTTKRAVQTALKSGNHDISLCHGLSGNALVLYEGNSCHSAGFGDGETVELVRIAAREAERTISDRSCLGLFVGSAGVGYLNLKLHRPSLPSILLPRREDFVQSRSVGAMS